MLLPFARRNVLEINDYRPELYIVPGFNPRWIVAKDPAIQAQYREEQRIIETPEYQAELKAWREDVLSRCTAEERLKYS